MKPIHILVGLTLSILLSGCMQTTQTTSGRDYLSQYESAPTGSASNIDAEVRAIASVEPLLRFPARIGLAKVYNGQICNLTETEATAWTQAHTQLGDQFGEFVPVSPLVAEMVYTPSSNPQDVVRKIRLGAARQHLDAVVIYEVFAETSEQTLPSAVANWTIIGAYFVPSEQSESVGYANALLIDVRNGYPYGTATATASKEDLHTAVTHYSRRQQQQNDAQVAAAVNLIPEVVKVFKTLQVELKQSPTQTAIKTATKTVIEPKLEASSFFTGETRPATR